MIRKHYFVTGIVQGVGFRPFIYTLACGNSLCGFVKNDTNGVEIELEGDAQNIEIFDEQLYSKLPPLARVDCVKVKEIKLKNDKTFEILKSSNDLTNNKTALISPDISTCQDCLRDAKNTTKYKNYFATNCTNCGPRYSIIETVPYDRKNSSMKKFGMCKSCKEEYNNPLNRRYHAQPISCNECGPKLRLTLKTKELAVSDEEKFSKTAKFINGAKIGAIKGIGGFHLVCDATNDEVIKKLREYKNRPTKPFAIMCKDIKQIKSLACVNEKEEELLTSKEAPIVILKNSLPNNLAKNLAPSIDRVGCFLAYTPLHYLLFKHLKNPIVATSANLANEPIITTAQDILKKLPFVDFILDYDRDIVNGVDDSILQVINGKIQTLRLARGYAPKVIKLASKSEKNILAVGANAKNSIAFVIGDNLILSPHIGDLDSLKAFEYFERTIETFKRFYNFEPDIIVHDKHPSYLTTKWAKEQNIRHVEVGHHLAHIYACKVEFELQGDYLGLSFDGTGYGDDGTLWGGEVFVGDERKYSFKPIKLLGADKAIKEPRRVALSMLFDEYSLEEVQKLDLACVKEFSHAELKVLHQSYSKNLNAPLSSSVGRMFDAVASFTNLLQYQSYEGEAGLLCEQNYNKDITKSFEYKIIGGQIEINFDFFDKDIVSIFINTLVKIVVDISKVEKLDVILSGGVFQNKTLLELILRELEKEKIKHYYQQETAINDGGIALGQISYVLNH